MSSSGVYKKTYCAFSLFPESCSIVYNCLHNWKIHLVKIETLNIFLFDVNGIYAISTDGHFTILLLSIIYFCLLTIFVLCVKSEQFSYFIYEFYDIFKEKHNRQFAWDILKRFHFKELQVAIVNFSSKTILGS